MHHPPLPAILLLATIGVVVWRLRRLIASPTRQELAPPPKGPDPLCQEVEGLIERLDGDMNALAASGKPITRMDEALEKLDKEPAPPKPPPRRQL